MRSEEMGVRVEQKWARKTKSGNSGKIRKSAKERENEIEDTREYASDLTASRGGEMKGRERWIKREGEINRKME